MAKHLAWSALGCVAFAIVAGVAIAYRAAPMGSFAGGIAASATIGGAIAGGFAIGRELWRRLPAPRRWSAALVLFALAVASGGMTAAALLGPMREHAIDSAMEEIEKQMPMLTAIRENAPEAYARFRERVVAVAERRGSPDDAALEARPIITEAAMARFPHADDTLLARLLAANVRQGQELRAVRPALCAAVFLGRPFGSLVPFVSTATVQEEQAAGAALFRTPRPQTPPPLATAIETEALLAAAFDEAAQRTGLPIERIAELLEGTGRDMDVCNATLAFLEALLRLPAAVAMPVYRRVLLEGQNAR